MTGEEERKQDTVCGLLGELRSCISEAEEILAMDQGPKAGELASKEPISVIEGINDSIKDCCHRMKQVNDQIRLLGR